MRIMESLPAILIKIEDDNLVNLNEGSLKDKYRLARYILNNPPQVHYYNKKINRT